MAVPFGMFQSELRGGVPCASEGRGPPKGRWKGAADVTVLGIRILDTKRGKRRDYPLIWRVSGIMGRNW